MEPLLPATPGRPLQDLAVEVHRKAADLASQLHPRVQTEVAELVRSMNCYYSNLIEGHNTHPRDIEKALQGEFAAQKEKRDLQLEASAHIHLQALIDKAESACESSGDITSPDYILWLHYEFYKDLSLELRQVRNPDTGELVEVKAGAFRQKDVVVGQHLAPEATSINGFMDRFHKGYRLENFSRLEQLYAAAASHHRLLWIHPFYDGNGRVARLYSHAYLKAAGVGSGLWSVARGFARNKEAYKNALAAADHPRKGDIDGRGNLSQQALEEFCLFFLNVCLDQITFMGQLLHPEELLQRIEIYTKEAVASNKLPKGSDSLLREALLAGQFERGKAAALTGYKERQARTVLNTLIKEGLLHSDTPKGPVRLSFPTKVVPRWFPNLYPAFE